VLLRPGHAFVEGVASPHSLLKASKRRLRRVRGRVDRGRGARLLARCWHCRASATRGPAGPPRERDDGEPDADGRRRQDRLDRAGLRAEPRGAHRHAATSPARKAWCSWWRSSTTSPPTTRSSSTSGRMAKVARGDVVVGALGHRQALFGYSGHIPDKHSQPGDVLQVLNLGGVLGICDSVNPDKRPAFRLPRARHGAAVSLPRRAHRRAGQGRAPQARPITPRRSTRTACRWWRSPAPAWRPARRPRPAAIISRMRHLRTRGPCVQGHRRLAAPGHPRDGGLPARAAA
jgi:hypothetical protein